MLSAEGGKLLEGLSRNDKLHGCFSKLQYRKGVVEEGGGTRKEARSCQGRAGIGEKPGPAVPSPFPPREPSWPWRVPSE